MIKIANMKILNKINNKIYKNKIYKNKKIIFNNNNNKIYKNKKIIFNNKIILILKINIFNL